MTVIAEALFDFMGQGIPVSDAENISMDSVCDLIDFDGDLDIPMEDSEVSPDVTPSNTTPPASCLAFTCRRTFENAFSPNDDCFIPSKKLKVEPVPMEFDCEPLFLPSYPTLQCFLNDITNFIYGSHRNYEDAFSPNDQVRRDLVVLLRNLGFNVPAHPVKKVIPKATRTCGLLSFRAKLAQNLLVSISLFR